MIERFTNEIRLIRNVGVKSLVWRCLENAPTYFWDIPSSNTGKYHPKDEFVKGGLVLHTQRVVKIANYLCQCLEIKNAERDCVIAASLLHDLCFPKGTTITIRKMVKWRFVKNKLEKEGRVNVIQKNIEEIKIGDEVLSWNGKEKEWDKVVKVFKRNADNLVTLNLSNGNELKCTKTHPIAVIRKGQIQWINAKDLNIGDELLQYKYNSLGMRLFNLRKRGKTNEEIYGMDKAKKISKKHSIANLLASNTKEARKERSDRTKELWRNPKFAEKNKVAIKIGLNKPEVKLKKIASAKEMWKNPEYIKRQAQSRSIIGKKLMTQSVEKKISYITRNLCPGEYKFNGRGNLGFSTDGFLPDFINIKGKRKLIEGYGCYWHACKKCGFGNVILSNGTTSIDIHKKDYRRISALKSKGYEVLIIWEHELSANTEEVKSKIKNFNFNPNVEVVKVVSKKIGQGNIQEEVYNIETEKNHNYFAYGILVHNCKNGFPENKGHTVDGHGYLWSELARTIYTKNEIRDTPNFNMISRLILFHMGNYDTPYVLDWDDTLATCVHMADFIASRVDINVGLIGDEGI